MTAHIVFTVNLLQDVNIVRPLVYLAAADFDVEIGFLVTDAFLKRDREGVWMAEVRTMAADVSAFVHTYDSPFAGYARLQGKHGLLIAGSESHLNAHVHVHQLFQSAPPGFLRVTLQHGFECVGFLQNHEQTAVHGRDITFAADIVCGWCDGEHLTAMSPSERSKLYVTGPQVLLQSRPALAIDAPTPGNGGIVCENLHSVRFTTEAGRQTAFIDEFEGFCGDLARRGRAVTLRPHPGGQYVIRNNVALPGNAAIENRPMYRVDLTRFDYGISAPSTVLLDMLLAGIPVAVWNDPSSTIDRSHYDGLHSISGPEAWSAFEQSATRDPAAFRSRQAAFLGRLKMPLDPSDVRTRFARLFAGAGAPIAVRRQPPARLLIIANNIIPSLEISFLRPLGALRNAGAVEVACLTEGYLSDCFADPLGDEAKQWVLDQIKRFDPALIVMCRYSGPHSAAILDAAAAAGIKLIYHLDDDLLNIPVEIVGERKWKSHNSSRKLRSISTLLRRADLIYCSTPALMDRIRELGFGGKGAIVAGSLYCPGEIRRRPVSRSHGKIGYMGFDHAHDLRTMLPALVAFLRRNPAMRFELFGSIPKPAELDEFGERITIVPPIKDYGEFMVHFATLDWDVGICPLADMPFNRVKADTKWVEYSSVGIAVVATGGMMYDDCCRDGCGLTATDDESWLAALETLAHDADARHAMILRAQDKVRRLYALDRLREQMLQVFDIAAGRQVVPPVARKRAADVAPATLFRPDGVSEGRYATA